MTSVPLYLLYVFLVQEDCANLQMGSVECIKSKNSTTFKPPSKNWRNTRSSWMSNRKLLSSLLLNQVRAGFEGIKRERYVWE